MHSFSYINYKFGSGQKSRPSDYNVCGHIVPGTLCQWQMRFCFGRSRFNCCVQAAFLPSCNRLAWLHSDGTLLHAIQYRSDAGPPFSTTHTSFELPKFLLIFLVGVFALFDCRPVSRSSDFCCFFFFSSAYLFVLLYYAGYVCVCVCVSVEHVVGRPRCLCPLGKQQLDKITRNIQRAHVISNRNIVR